MDKTLAKLMHSNNHYKNKIEVATDNINRSEIPGEKEKILKKQKSFAGALNKDNGSVKKTNANHLSGTVNQRYQTSTKKYSTETGINKNSIDVEANHETLADSSMKIKRNLAVYKALLDQHKKVIER